MSHHWSLISILISIILFHITYIHSTPIHSEIPNHIVDGDSDEYQRIYNSFIYAVKSIANEPNSYERIKLLNQLRESLNRLCINGFFGATHAAACRQVVDVIHQTYANNHANDDENIDTSNEVHGIQKRFFCNGFIGCKSASG
ncbi:unnamed protein product [Adineta steineri]|uniref:Uncharacterized protein n=1 Tax=Adineta steineri TaxID=433720 RepID=A0A814HXY4_9BILA|nr:unnamed protein product [Adineta steineri]CAF1560082.1 unnamed protein product [Adineta steineri]